MINRSNNIFTPNFITFSFFFLQAFIPTNKGNMSEKTGHYKDIEMLIL